jgi:hypothetical protein
MGKFLNQKNFHYFFWRPFGSSVSIEIHFFLQVNLSCQQFDNCSHCVNDTSGTFAAGVVDKASLTLVANLPPVSLTQVANLLGGN